MAGDGSDFVKRLFRGVAAARKVIGSDLIASSLPVAIGTQMARPVVERRRRRADGSERYVLVLPFGEGDTRIEMQPGEYEALTREMIRFWNEQVQLIGQIAPPAENGDQR
ncbi:MAG: hypothetical protein BGP06_21075 [Rhizobiales bacterium 65-9]|nr:hypothetical protein [Hyphomicrobiales bacterium]OJY36509.1 MAG: hypothetical protein BGP06_21075 [Rhizobiales bacterium 65-9]